MPARRSDPFLGVPGKAMKNPRGFFDVVAGRSVLYDVLDVLDIHKHIYS